MESLTLQTQIHPEKQPLVPKFVFQKNQTRLELKTVVIVNNKNLFFMAIIVEIVDTLVV